MCLNCFTYIENVKTHGDTGMYKWHKRLWQANLENFIWDSSSGFDCLLVGYAWKSDDLTYTSTSPQEFLIYFKWLIVSMKKLTRYVGICDSDVQIHVKDDQIQLAWGETWLCHFHQKQNESSPSRYFFTYCSFDITFCSVGAVDIVALTLLYSVLTCFHRHSIFLLQLLSQCSSFNMRVWIALCSKPSQITCRNAWFFWSLVCICLLLLYMLLANP